MHQFEFSCLFDFFRISGVYLILFPLPGGYLIFPNTGGSCIFVNTGGLPVCISNTGGLSSFRILPGIYLILL